MEEYSRIIIEEYCMNHPKTQKADFLWEMVHMSYDIACEPEPWQLMHLSQLISRERNPELRDALEKEQPDLRMLVNSAGFGKSGSVEEILSEKFRIQTDGG